MTGDVGIKPVPATPLLLDVVRAAKTFISLHQDLHPQIALQRPASMDPEDLRQYTRSCKTLTNTGWLPKDFDTVCTGAEWVQPFLDLVEAHSGKKAVRTRIMTLDPNRCLTYHVDSDSPRYHLVVETHPDAMFIVDDKVYRMPVVGQIYTIRADLFHTALNPTITKTRTHIVTGTA